MNHYTLSQIREKVKKAKRKPLGKIRTRALQAKFNKRRENENKNNWTPLCISPSMDKGTKAFNEIMHSKIATKQLKTRRVGGKTTKKRK